MSAAFFNAETGHRRRDGSAGHRRGAGGRTARRRPAWGREIGDMLAEWSDRLDPQTALVAAAAAWSLVLATVLIWFDVLG